MSDNAIRKLERKAQAGDVDAQAKLASARDRAGLSSVDAAYLQSYLELCEELAAKGPGALHRGDYIYDEEGEHPNPSGFSARLEALTALARSQGVTPALIRTQFVAQDAMTNSGSWYNSSADC